MNKALRSLILLFATAPTSATSAADGAPIVDGRFRNRAEPTERASFGADAGVWVRKTWTTFVPRAGAATRVPYDSVAIARSPSLTWIGHATFLVRMDGVTFLTDPMFSNWAGPIPIFGSRRAVPPGVPLDELPIMDFVLLTHDHYDHADRASVRQLAKRGVRFVVPQGLGEWVRRAGGTAVELDWWQSVEIKGVKIHCVPAQHFSGRSLSDGNKRLWAGWVVSGPTRRFYHAGDSGYSADFKAWPRPGSSVDSEYRGDTRLVVTDAVSSAARPLSYHRRQARKVELAAGYLGRETSVRRLLELHVVLD